MYKAIFRPILFCFDPEKVHHFVFNTLKLLHLIPGIALLTRLLYTVKHPKLKRTVFGLDFDNPVGLAAGFDKEK